MKRKLSIILCGLSLAISGCSSWVYGDSNQPIPSELPKIENQVTTTILWQKNLGQGGEKQEFAFQPAIIGNTIYAVSADGRFYSIDAETGHENYQVKLGNGIVGGVSAAGNYLLVGTQNGDLMALSAADGQIVWRTPLKARMLSPAAVSDAIIVAHTIAGDVIALSPENGSILWHHYGNSPDLSLHVNGSPLIGGGVVIVTSDDGFFTVLDEKTGVVVAHNRIVNAADSHKINTLVLTQMTTPQINNATLFGSAYQRLVYAIDLQAGKIKWQNTEVSSAHDFAISPSDIYLTTADDSIVALSQTDGHELWHNDQLRGRHLSPPVAIPNYLGVVDYQGYLHWLNATNGQLIGQKQIGKQRATSIPLILPDKIIWQLANGQLVSLRPN